MSAVTAVPIRPIARGSVLKLWIALLLLAAAGAGLAWLGTAPLQVITLESGVRYRVLRQGTGPLMTPADAIVLRYKLHVNSVTDPVVQDSDQSGQPFAATTSDVFPGFGEAMLKMRQGGEYILWLPPGTHMQGEIPPAAPFTASDTLVFEIRDVRIGAGQASALQMQRMQQMQQMQQQQLQEQLQQQLQQQGGAPPNPHGGTAPPAGAGGR
jgi:FKBP-type peptidyl-prolyl cis-trans isomerase FkpA